MPFDAEQWLEEAEGVHAIVRHVDGLVGAARFFLRGQRSPENGDTPFTRRNKPLRELAPESLGAADNHCMFHSHNID